MNRSKLKTYAPQARRDFIRAVTDRAAYYGLTKDKLDPMTEQGDVAIIAGKPFPRAVAEKRKRLEERIKRQGFDQVMEAMAYTWFNRFVAIRFMELHGYLNHGYRVLSHPEGNATPEIVEHAEHVDLPRLDRENVIELKVEGTKEAELYHMILIAQCNALNKTMPFLFEPIDNETELLLPDNLLHSDSLIRKLVNEIPEEEWQEVEIIGWLYQFYISEKKDQVIGKVVKSEDIPAATQLFTPNWIVKYLVQNSLGRQWVATYPNSALKRQMEYYVEPAEQTPEVQEQLKAITPDSLNPEELTLLDPACGSGHILVEAYDLLKAIYQERGYRAKDIPRMILDKNLYGLEIDDRAAQLAAFALMMKARADDRRIFSNGVRPHVLAIQDSKGLKAKDITEAFSAPILKAKLPPREMLFEEMEDERAPLFSRKNLSVKGDIAQASVAQLIELFEHGKTFGSLIRVPDELSEKLPAIAERVEDVLTYGEMFGHAAASLVGPIVAQARILGRLYDSVVMNPPYMGSRGINEALREFAKRRFPDSKTDLYAQFVERGLSLVEPNGNLAMITMHGWMFLSSFEQLRKRVLSRETLITMAHFGPRAFSEISGEVVQTAAFSVLRNHISQFKPMFFRLLDGTEEEKEDALVSRKFSFSLLAQDDLRSLPGVPIAYWVSQKIHQIFEQHDSFNVHAETKQGLATTNNDLFLRLWYEVGIDRIGFGCVSEDHAEKTRLKWFPCNKGGSYRRWYGNNMYIVNYENRGKTICDYIDNTPGVRVKSSGRVINRDYYFKPGFTWSSLSSASFAMRYCPAGFIFETKGSMCFPKDQREIWDVLAYCNSKLVDVFLAALSPTMDYHEGPLGKIPFKPQAESRIADIARELTKLAKADWDDSEISWDFCVYPLLDSTYNTDTVQKAIEGWEALCRSRFDRTKSLEEENNRLLIEFYNLKDELSPDVSEDRIALYFPEQEEDIKRLVSYAIGCMMGRYSLDNPGLIYVHSGNERFWEIYREKHEKAAGDQNENNSCDSWSSFPPDQDGIIPITDSAWFPDDAANRVVDFIAVAWPREHLEENLKFVAESLGPKRGESPRDTLRRYLATGFYKHHLSMYKKRPIYWLFSSGKQRAFQCLVYLHRYNEGTLSRMRTEYVIPLQGKISARIGQLEKDIKAATSTSHGKRLQREQDKLVKQKAELHAFDENLRHYADKRISLDLDNGVKVNYGKFGDLLAEVKAIIGKKGK